MTARRDLIATATIVAVLAAGLGWLTTGTTTQARPHAVASLRAANTADSFYFVMTDRFANGDPSNDTGGLGEDPQVSGFDPSNSAYYQGGDLQGLMDQLDYIEGLGVDALWLSPAFKNLAVQPEDNSAGYHGYWITDFTQIDPHLGTNEEFAALVAAAHERGMKVYLDIITNHTADVIGYEGGQRMPYASTDDSPYLDADGNAFDDRAAAGTTSFPALDAATSFPYVPVIPDGQESLKQPEWLNDVTNYHNRGNTTFTGEDSLYGDFFGLDDLFTENPTVVNGMVDIYTTWIGEYDVDGFRIDTMKHVNDEFWQAFAPQVLEYAHEHGKDDFFMFGEVFDTSRPVTSHFTTQDDVQAVLDFPFQAAARSYASTSGPADDLAGFFADDDWYTDGDSNAYQLPTFLGNHDMGRFGWMLQADNPGASDAELLQRYELANALMFLSRGNPIVYYGDEQGFTGEGGDRAARQTMFATTIPEYLADDPIGTDATLATDSYDATHPLYGQIAALQSLIDEHPALRNGAMQARYADAGSGVFAYSRMDRDEQREYVVALNNADEPRTVEIPTWSAGSGFTPLYGGGQAASATADGTLTVTVPALSAVVYEADATITVADAAPQVTLAEPAAVEGSPDRVEVSADVAGDGYAEVSFWARPDGGEWTYIGTDDSAPYRVFHSVADLAPGAQVEYQAVVADASGRTATSASAVGTVTDPVVTLLTPEAGATLGASPVISVDVNPYRPGTVVTFERQVTGGDWEVVGTDATAPTYQFTDDLGGVTTGEVNYRATVTQGAASVTTRIVAGKAGALAQPGQVSLPGSFNEAMGCEEWWAPWCEATFMTFDEATATWSITVDLPAGEHEYKIAIDGSWDLNYGQNGLQDGPNMTLSLDAPATVTFTYDDATHLVTVE